MRAARAGANRGQSSRYAVNHHVQIAADHQADSTEPDERNQELGLGQRRTIEWQSGGSERIEEGESGEAGLDEEPNCNDVRSPVGLVPRMPAGS